MTGEMSIYYDDEGDYLEIFIEGAGPSYGEELGNDTTLFKNEKTNEVIGVGVLNFRTRAKSLEEIKLHLPFKINFSMLNKRDLPSVN